jgi:hypothetical protein
VLPTVQACGGGGSVDDGDPVSRVEHELEDAPELMLDPLVLLGGDDGLLVGGFGFVYDVLLGPELELFVLDVRARQVLRFDPAFDSVSRFPPQGQGPGEVEIITSLGIVGDTLLLLGERDARRVQYFTLHGELVEIVPEWTTRAFRHPLAPNIPNLPQSPSVALPDGSGISSPATFLSSRLMETGESRLPKLAVRHRPGDDDNGQVIAEAWTRVVPTEIRTYRGIPIRYGHPLPPRSFLSILPDASGTVTAQPVESAGLEPRQGDEEQAMEVILRTVDGDTVFRRTLRAPEPRVRGWRLDEALERPMRGVEIRARDNLAEPPTEADVRRALQSAGFLRSLRGPVLDLVGTQNGDIWIALDGGSGDCWWRPKI